MLKNYVPRNYKTITEYELSFDDGRGNGFAFPCNAKGEVPEDLNECAKANLERCLKRPDKFRRWNKVVTIHRNVCDPAHGTCVCGREVELWDEYYGACQCECGRWYNLFGQELLPPDQWEIDPSEDDYYGYDY